MDKICEMKMTLENYISAQMCDLASADTHELGEAIDMIKDLAEAEYYCEATKAMKSAGEELDEYDGRMGYTPNYRNMRRAADNMNRAMSNGRMGYTPMEKEYLDGYLHNPAQFRDEMRERNHGDAYSEWKMARRHYTETHSPMDKQKMDMHTNEHVSEVMMTIKDMWHEADPELRTEMKNKLQQLLNDLK